MSNSILSILGILGFFLTGLVFNEDPVSIEKSYGRECLALVGYAEARDQGDIGMAAVMQVVLNRTQDSSGRWPEDICGVVQQRNQFKALEQIRYPRSPHTTPDLEAWDRAHTMADQMIAKTGPSLGSCKSATNFDLGENKFHLKKICQLGSHFFL